MKSFDVIVVGGGVMGLSSAWQLLTLGHKVLVLDQFPIPNEIGSSHGGSRITRTAYFEHPNYVPLLQEAHQLWEELQDATSRNLVNWVGGLYMGHPESDIIAGTLASARVHNLETTSYTSDELKSEYPQFSIPDHLIGVYEKDAGVLYPEQCIRSLKEKVLELGGEILESEAVISINPHPADVQVNTLQNRFSAGHVILASGVWSNQWLRQFTEIKMRVTRQVACWFESVNTAHYQNLPITCFQDREEPFFYSFPWISGELGIKMAIHDPGSEVDPNSPRISTQDEVEQVENGFRKYYTGYQKYFQATSSQRVLKVSTCLYTNSPDSHFIVDQLEPRISVITGCSGHGFKFAPILGKIVARSIIGDPIHEASFLKLDRFKKI
jgi:monomeric sarcosine oxidase